jgi:hypothetical protein
VIFLGFDGLGQDLKGCQLQQSVQLRDVRRAMGTGGTQGGTAMHIADGPVQMLQMSMQLWRSRPQDTKNQEPVLIGVSSMRHLHVNLPHAT